MCMKNILFEDPLRDPEREVDVAWPIFPITAVFGGYTPERDPLSCFASSELLPTDNSFFDPALPPSHWFYAACDISLRYLMDPYMMASTLLFSLWSRR